MIALLDTSEDLTVCEQELGLPVEQFLTPLTRFRRQRPNAMFAIDNGAFSSFDKAAFLALLKREEECRHLCRFVAVPDVIAIDPKDREKKIAIGDARRTLEVFEVWRYKLTGWRLALVAQDGLENLDIPWDGIEAIFVGGSTQWKMSHAAACVVKAAKALDKWVHIGRVNEPERLDHFEELGANSFDGSGIAQYTHQRLAIRDRGVLPLFAQALPEEVEA